MTKEDGHRIGASVEGAAIVDAIKRSGVEFVVSVPDRVTSETVLRQVASDSALRLVRVCKEDEGVSICAALSFCDKRAILLMQHTGLLDSVNALRGIAVEYRLPVVMMVGLLGHESDAVPAQSRSYGVRIVAPILDAMGIAYEFLHRAGDEQRIAPAVERAYANSTPLALLIGRSPV
ncbi:MAG: decarboxylase [Betaproteobacteria bacterium]|nr:decarboxylase [Betaproteobacteria bacterium]